MCSIFHKWSALHTVHSPHPHRLSHEIGKGEFGTVWEGEWAVEGGRSRTVAIKTLNPHMSEKDRIRFLQEAVIIGQFRHPNIVRLLGVVKDGEPVSGVETGRCLVVCGIVT